MSEKKILNLSTTILSKKWSKQIFMFEFTFDYSSPCLSAFRNRNQIWGLS